MANRDINSFIPLLDIICCPQSGTTLTLLQLSDLEILLSESEKQKIQKNTIGAMISNDSGYAYPIIGAVISFKEVDRLVLSSIATTDTVINKESTSTGVSKSVQEWYDNYGWKKNASGQYHDTALYSSGVEHALRYYEFDSHLSLLHRLMGGKFVLDAASGAIAHPEYSAYSWFYQWRVCVDLSSTALNEAAEKIGERGYCCLADIANLPFRDNAFDGVISGYTIQHIPEDRQSKAVSELYRVLAPGKHCNIMTHLQIGTAGRRVRKILKWFGKTPPIKPEQIINEQDSSSSPALYGYNRTVKWWKQLAVGLDAIYEIRGLRLLNKQEFEYYIGNSLIKTRRLRILELIFPKLIASLSHYGLLILTKPD